MPTSSGPRPNFQQNGNSLRCSHSEVSQRNVHCYKGIVWYVMTLINKLFLIDHQQTTPVKAKRLADVFSSFDFQSHSRTYLINLITTVTRNVDGQQANIKIAKFYLVSSWTAPVCCQTVNVFFMKGIFTLMTKLGQSKQLWVSVTFKACWSRVNLTYLHLLYALNNHE